ncbi:glycosyltransferase [Candidatus Nomurabacteria bacterium]|nr:glycosyltransferase [Candidatus Nomurabacteria bacterium]
MKKLTIQMIVFHEKEMKYIPYIFDSLKKQTFQDFEFLLIDNSEGTSSIARMVEDAIKDLGCEYRIIKSEKGNVGFAQGHNIGYREVKSPYVLLLNPDMYLMPDTLARMVDIMESNDKTAAVSTRLMRWDFEKVQGSSAATVLDQAQEGFTNQIDAIGVRLLRNRRAVEWFAQEVWSKDIEGPAALSNIFDKHILEVFGISGALAMYRKSCIDKVLLPGDNIFDPTYHSYKEDVDLAYRFRNAGYTAYVVLDSVAYHDRTAAAPRGLSDLKAAMNKGKQSEYVKLHSYKNHIRTLYKNEYWQNFLQDLPWIIWFELKKLAYMLVIHPVVLFRSLHMMAKDWKYTKQARKQIVAERKMYWKGLRRWF